MYSAIQSCLILNFSCQLLDITGPEVSFSNERAVSFLETALKRGAASIKANLTSSFPLPLRNASVSIEKTQAIYSVYDEGLEVAKDKRNKDRFYGQILFSKNSSVRQSE